MARATSTKPRRATRTLTHYCPECRSPIARGESYLPRWEGRQYTARHWPDCASAEERSAVTEARAKWLVDTVMPDIEITRKDRN
jgi:hypothetical protein